jgi:hypothetical protein
VVYKWKNKAWVTACMFTIWFTTDFEPTVDIYYLGKERTTFKVSLFFVNVSGCLKALMELQQH